MIPVAEHFVLVSQLFCEKKVISQQSSLLYRHLKNIFVTGIFVMGKSNAKQLKTFTFAAVEKDL